MQTQMNRRRVILPLLALIGLVGAAFGAARVFRQSPGPTSVEVWRNRAWSTTLPESYTEAERIAAITAHLNSDPLPPGFSLIEDLGTATGVLTGLTAMTGEKQLVISCMDESEDLDHIDFYENGVLTVTATRANNMIRDVSGSAFATVSLMVGPTLPVTVEYRWFTPQGQQYKVDEYSAELPE